MTNKPSLGRKADKCTWCGSILAKIRPIIACALSNGVWVQDFGQVQTIGWNTQVFGKCRLVFEGILHGLKRQLFHANLDTGTHHEAHHSAQKTIGRNVKNEPVVFWLNIPMRFGEGAPVMLHPAVGFAKREKSLELWE